MATHREMHNRPKLRKAGKHLVGKRTFIDFTIDSSILERTAGIILLYHGYEFTVRKIAEHTGLSIDAIRNCLVKYRTPLGPRDVTINIMSKI